MRRFDAVDRNLSAYDVKKAYTVCVIFPGKWFGF